MSKTNVQMTFTSKTDKQNKRSS